MEANVGTYKINFIIHFSEFLHCSGFYIDTIRKDCRTLTQHHNCLLCVRAPIYNYCMEKKQEEKKTRKKKKKPSLVSLLFVYTQHKNVAQGRGR